jgi:hypothetical protein
MHRKNPEYLAPDPSDPSVPANIRVREEPEDEDEEEEEDDGREEDDDGDEGYSE